MNNFESDFFLVKTEITKYDFIKLSWRYLHVTRPMRHTVIIFNTLILYST